MAKDDERSEGCTPPMSISNHPEPDLAAMTNEAVPPANNMGCCGKTITNHENQEPDVLHRLTAGEDCAPACCEKEDGPHCDDDCVKAYATLECHTTSHADPQHEQPTDGHCNSHFQAAMNRYEKLMADASCLCKSVLSNSMIHCCGSDAGYMLLPPIPSSRGSSESGSLRRPLSLRRGTEKRRALSGRNSSKTSLSEEKFIATESKVSICGDTTHDNLTGKGCCGEKNGGSGDMRHDVNKNGGTKCCGATMGYVRVDADDCCDRIEKKSCCGDGKCGTIGKIEKEEGTTPKKHLKDSKDHGGLANVTPFMWSRDTSRADEEKPVQVKSCRSECCSGGPVGDCSTRGLCDGNMDTKEKSVTEASGHIDDIERAALREHVLLNVQGMTCTGCENKLKRALEATPGTSNIKTSFLNSRADFDLDQSVVPAEEVVKQVHTVTGFHVARVQSEHQMVDVLMEKSKARELMLRDIPGLIETTIIDKKRATLTYDPNVIGVRRLLDLACGGPGSLAPPTPNTALSDSRRLLKTMGWKTLLATILTLPIVILAWAPTNIDDKVKAIVSMVLATFVQGVAVTEFYKNAFRALWHDRTVELDTLVVISITAAYVYSIVAFSYLMVNRPLATKEFFETSTLLITLVLLGRLIATYARLRAVKAVSIRSLQGPKAILCNDKESNTEIDARLLQFGDHFAVEPHSRVSTDGIVVAGQSEIDESMLTGESVPVLKAPGDDVIAGTVNGDGQLKVQLTRLPGKNTVTDIAELVEQANSAKPKVQDLADRVATWFIPVVVTVALITLAVQIAVSVRIRRESPGSAAGTAISYAIAVLAVSCPCALGLAVPMVLVITGGVAARCGVIIKSTEATERSWQITDVVFDKTGTLTMPDLEVTDEHIVGPDPDHARAVSLALAKGNKHPVSVSLARHLLQGTEPSLEAQDIRVIPGCGVEATVSGSLIKAGNAAWLSFTNRDVVQLLARSGKTILCVTYRDSLVAVYGLKTTLRPEAPALIKALQERNIAVHLISGDSSLAVQTCADTLSIPLSNVRSRCSPAEKQSYVLGLSSSLCNDSCEDLTLTHTHESRGSHESHHANSTSPDAKSRKVLFAGDGTNDAIALSSSFVGVQIGTASDVVSSTASVSLLGSLTGIIYLLDVSKAAYRRIVFNFVWAAVYNVFAILLASGAFVRVRIEPQWAGLGEIASVLPVVLAAMTMMRWKREF
ncbi:P-type cation-transporting ATPase-like protein [Elsinoe australis]|uniref:P-type cation-transporting ATPase-like protein n=1 Tax=Elsinoe australis TaxID=40998 RepID=A0A4U7APR1_9PEZI|nr:P-type cation-transporting ATPase-like protein [Elsinoe australis]